MSTRQRRERSDGGDDETDAAVHPSDSLSWAKLGDRSLGADSSPPQDRWLFALK